MANVRILFHQIRPHDTLPLHMQCAKILAIDDGFSEHTAILLALHWWPVVMHTSWSGDAHPTSETYAMPLWRWISFWLRFNSYFPALLFMAVCLYTPTVHIHKLSWSAWSKQSDNNNRQTSANRRATDSPHPQVIIRPQSNRSYSPSSHRLYVSSSLSCSPTSCFFGALSATSS